ncbi:dipeptide ABC transporter ATP-binding protein [Natroniella sulfidigena]|uniref:ABC transporter ATP-binding protein n=1 Tax=Natroniella sulfidigena TaxID=723921 RepID=UPI00200AD861|nr:dipeptide ABC transporter ATP-binding protein [Natroniella sulfidigena]MCK8815801.1 dipeptide ABC transporter ATP-binding protein [Natroniella sulfidigena]
MAEAILEVNNLKKHFPVKGGLFNKQQEVVKAVDGLSFNVRKGETLGLVGESGCGKSTTGRVLLRLLNATEGEVLFEGQDIHSLNKKELRSLRREMQMIFQDPYASLNPRMKVGDIIGEPLEIHGLAKGREKKRIVKDLLDKVGLVPDYISRYPHEFSGGQRQRIGIARALAVDPKVIVCDEPVSALDVSVQAQVINLMKDLQKELELTYIFIAHDLSVVRHISDRVAVMYLGRIVELADKNKLYEDPKHPYTKALLSAIPVADPEVKREKIILEGDVPSPINPPSGCTFHTRCPFAEEICKREVPEFAEQEEEHFVACHLVD